MTMMIITNKTNKIIKNKIDLFHHVCIYIYNK